MNDISGISTAGMMLVPAELLSSLLNRVEQLTTMVEEIHARATTKPEIDPQARYPLKEAAAYLHTSPSTLKRRAARHKLVILYDGKTPFIMGAEVLRYARCGTKRRRAFKRRKADPDTKATLCSSRRRVKSNHTEDIQ